MHLFDGLLRVPAISSRLAAGVTGVATLALVACTSSDHDRLSLLRARTLGFLESQRDTTEGYVAAASHFERSFAEAALEDDLLNLARVYILAESWTPGVDRWGKAAKVLSRFRQQTKGKTHAAADYLEGLVFFHTHDLASAAEKFRAVAQSHPDVAAAWFQLGASLLLLKDYPGTVAALAKTIELEPEHVAAHYQTYRALISLKDPRQEEWGKNFQLLQAKSAKVSERHNEKCRFTLISLVPTQPKIAPPRPSLPLTPVDLEAAILTLELRAAAAGDLDGDGAQDLLVAAPQSVHLLRSEGGQLRRTEPPVATGLDLRAVRLADADNDADLDFLTLDGDALHLFLRDDDGQFTRKGDAGLGARGVRAARWVDYDHDGDLDVVAAVHTEEKSLSPQVFRNNGENVFELQGDVFPAKTAATDGPYQFAIVDLNPGNEIDLVFPDPSGAAVALINQRRGPFSTNAVASLRNCTSVVGGDFDNDGRADLLGFPAGTGDPLRMAVAVGPRGAPGLPAFESGEEPGDWGEVRSVDKIDCDLNAGLDILVASTQGLYVLARAEDDGAYDRLDVAAGAWLWASRFDADGNFHPDVAAIDSQGRLHVWKATPENAPAGQPRYAGITLELRGRADNSLGVGTHVEVFAGESYQQLRIEDGRRLHIGLGKDALEDLDGLVLRWPNGLSQTVTPVDGVDGRFVVKQRPGAMVSCPFLYTYNGSEYRFLTDVIGIAPLDEWLPPGGTPHLDPEEYVRIPEEALTPVDGELRLVITEELRETTYLDRLRLVAVTHPTGSTLQGDESTRQGAVDPLQVLVLPDTGIRGDLAVHSGTGRDGTDSAARPDGRYFHPYEETRSQWLGWVEPYTMEIALPSDLDRTSAALLLRGRVAWYDSRVAYALHQHGRTWQPHRLEVVDRAGSTLWTLPDAGLPAGMDRTVAVPLELPSGSHAVRLGSTYRLLWDEIRLAKVAAAVTLRETGTQTVRLQTGSVQIKTRVLGLRTASLGYHGYSATAGDLARHEQTYRFEEPSSWRDFPLPEGRATRYGDVRELVSDADDLLVVLPPGDSIHLAFEAPPTPGPDETVTYFLRVTGWAKESGFHVGTGRDIAPLPFAAMKRYPASEVSAPSHLAYQKYLSTYQTRRIANE